jgi:lysyl-tRNA synthetase class 2
MRFTISKQIFEKYPGFVCGALVCKDIHNSGVSEEALGLLKEAESGIKAQFSLENLSQVPFFAAWRRAYSLFGAEPSRFKCSSEAIARRVLKGDSIRHINKLVDVYNYISMKYRTPVGGEDLAKIDGDISLGFSEGGEPFVPLGVSEVEHPDKGEVIYADGKEVICRRWNWRESEKTKLTEGTREAFLAIDALPPLTRDEVSSALDEFAGLVRRICSSEVTTFMLDSENAEIAW